MIQNVFAQLVFLKKDLCRWPWKFPADFFYSFLEQGVWAVVVYRIGRALYLINIPVLKVFLRLIAYIMMKFSEVFFGVSLNPSTDIGPGLYVGHTGALIIHPRARVGRNLNIGTGVIIGEKGMGLGGYPVIGNDVYIGVGAKVLGDISVGDGAKIGANAVVMRNVPAGATAVGIPARVIKIENKESRS